MAIAQLETPSSALRYGLLKIKPIPVEDSVKIKGIKYKRTGIRFEQEDEQTKEKSEFEKYEDFINYRYGQIFSRMPIPEKFSKEKLVEHFITEAIHRTKNDKEFVEHLEQKEKSLFEYVSFLKQRFDSKMESYYRAEAAGFINSNLPMSFFTKSSMFINTYERYLTLVKRVVRRFEIRSHRPGVRNQFRTTEQELKAMQKELSPVIDKMDLCSSEYSSLNLYVILWSADSIEQIDEPKFIDYNRIDQVFFEEFSMTYSNELKQVRKMLNEMSKSYEPDLFNKQTEQESSTTLMLGKLLSSSSICRA
jgi:hypothetical protein